MYVVISKPSEQARWVTMHTPFNTLPEAARKADGLRRWSYIAQVRELGPPLEE